MKVTHLQLALSAVHPDWYPCLDQAFAAMDADYLLGLEQTDQWLPGWQHLLRAFSQPLAAVRYVLLGESPYPRKASANGYAFWDAAVGDLWTNTGFSKAVNRATSLRNLLKMLLYARGDLQTDFSQAAIASLDKTPYVQTLTELFQGLLHHGFLLLNATLVFEPKRVRFHAKHWRPFMAYVLEYLNRNTQDVQLILLGNVAQDIPERQLFTSFLAEHPYQISFIRNPEVVAFFQPFQLLMRAPYDHNR